MAGAAEAQLAKRRRGGGGQWLRQSPSREESSAAGGSEAPVPHSAAQPAKRPRMAGTETSASSSGATAKAQAARLPQQPKPPTQSQPKRPKQQGSQPEARAAPAFEPSSSSSSDWRSEAPAPGPAPAHAPAAAASAIGGPAESSGDDTVWRGPGPDFKGWLKAAPNEGWALHAWLPDQVAGTAWARQVLSTDPPCLTLRDMQADGLPRVCDGEMHAGLAESAPTLGKDSDHYQVRHDCKLVGGEMHVQDAYLQKLFKCLLQDVRYPPTSLECSWRACCLEACSRKETTPADLRGQLPDRPFVLLDNVGDDPAPQPPHFGSHPLRPEQLRSLSWMLSRELSGAGGDILECENGAFVVEWRRFFATGDASPNLGQDQLVDGALVRILRPGFPCTKGVVTQRRSSDKRGSSGEVLVQLEDGPAVNFLPDEVVYDGSDHVLAVGSRVQVAPGLKNPTYGWGGVLPNTVGVVVANSREQCTVRFPQHQSWKCRPDEVQLLRDGSKGEQQVLIEVRARAQYHVRGGILADKIGYGKTATTIALLDSTLRHPLPDVPAIDRGRFIPAKGTLVIVPSNLLDQWLNEVSKFVWDGNTLRGQMKHGWSPNACPVKVFAMTNVTPLTRVTAGQLAEADLILCSYRLLFSSVYVSRRNELTGRGHGVASARLAELAEQTRRLLAGETSMRSGRKGEQHTRKWAELAFPVLEMFFWRRVVFDEFHELEGFDSLQQNSLQHLRSHSRWGLTGTPPVNSNAGAIFMSSLFRVDLPGFLTKQGTEGLKPGEYPDLRPWEGDRLLGETAGSFLDRFVRQNTAELPHIRLEEHVVVLHHKSEERVLYLGQAHDAPDLHSEDAFKTEENVKALERLLKLCSHFQAAGDNVANAKEECHRIGEQKERRVVRARNQVHRCCYVIALLEKKLKDAAPKTPRRRAAATAAAWHKELKESEKRMSFEGDYGKKAVEELERAQREVGAESRLSSFVCFLEFHRPKDDDLAVFFGPADSRRGYGAEWEILAKKPADDMDLPSLLGGQASEQIHNLKELADATSSLAFFQRTVAAMAADDSPEMRSCSVCMVDGILLSRLAITPCAHTFCIPCLEETVAHHKQCPICRTALTPKDVQAISKEVVAATAALEAETTASASSSSSSTAPAGLGAGAGAGGGAGAGASRRAMQFDKYGTKLAAVVEKLQELRAADATAKVILFVQFDELKRKVAAALEEFGIPTSQLQGAVGHRSNVIHDWQYNPSSQSFVLLLSLAQSASGTNLTAASHVVFLHPMLASTQEKAIGYELQAIGRARRHGQKRDTVHVWRFVTADTIEQLITQKNCSALWERESAREAVVAAAGARAAAAAAAARAAAVGAAAAEAGAAGAAEAAEESHTLALEDVD